VCMCARARKCVVRACVRACGRVRVRVGMCVIQDMTNFQLKVHFVSDRLIRMNY